MLPSLFYWLHGRIFLQKTVTYCSFRTIWLIRKRFQRNNLSCPLFPIKLDTLLFLPSKECTTWFLATLGLFSPSEWLSAWGLTSQWKFFSEGNGLPKLRRRTTWTIFLVRANHSLHSPSMPKLQLARADQGLTLFLQVPYYYCNIINYISQMHSWWILIIVCFLRAQQESGQEIILRVNAGISFLAASCRCIGVCAVLKWCKLFEQV